MLLYVDSSFLLRILFGEPGAKLAVQAYNEADERFASILLQAECTTTLLRTNKSLGKYVRQGWLKERQQALQTMLSGVNLRAVDESIVQLLEKEKRLGGCRSLDALHLATALLYRRLIGQDLTIASYDPEMLRVARGLKFPIVPQS